jgi:hypothetical protein
MRGKNSETSHFIEGGLRAHIASRRIALHSILQVRKRISNRMHLLVDGGLADWWRRAAIAMKLHIELHANI